MAQGQQALDAQTLLARLASLDNQFQQQQEQIVGLSNQVTNLSTQLSQARTEAAQAAARAEVAQKEKEDIIKIALSRLSRDDGVVDNKGVGQPFKLSGKKDSGQDFSE